MDMPAIVPPYDVQALEIPEEHQWMTYYLQQYFCPPIATTVTRNLLKFDKVMTNGAQNGYDGEQPHADYLNNRDIGTPLPRWDKMQRIFTSSFIRGNDIGEFVECVPGVHGIDANKAMPSIATIVENNWYIVANSRHKTDPNRLVDFAQTYINGVQYWTVYPFIFDRPIKFHKYKLMEWKSNELPDHLMVYGTYSDDNIL
jgi:hypothetical protein